MKPMTLDGTKAERRRSEALRLLCKQAIAEPAGIWEELESRGIHATPGTIYQAISHYNLQPRTPDEDQGAEAVLDEDKGMSLKDVEMVASIAKKAGGVRQLMRLLRTMEQMPR